MKVLIADDEEYTREGIVESILWEEYGINEVMQAQNGYEAEEIAKWFHPDLVITDIRMPKLDGIAFAKGLLKVAPDSKIIFISGYMEIDYYKSAIKMSAIDYIEKPIDIMALKKAIKRATDSIKEARKKEDALNDSKSYKENRLFYALTNPDKKDLCEDIEKEKVIGYQQNAVCLICVGENVKEIAEQIKREEQKVIVNLIDSRQLEFIWVYRKKDEYRIMPFIQKLLDDYQDIKIAKGTAAQTYQDIAYSFEAARLAMQTAFYQSKKRFFSIEATEYQKRVIDPSIYGEFCRLLSGSPSQLEIWFKGIFEMLKANPYYTREQIYSLFSSLIVALDSRYAVILSKDALNNKEQYIFKTISQFEHIEEIEDYTYTLLNKAINDYKSNEGYSRLSKGVIDYVAKHFSEPEMSVSDIADHLHMSGAYLNVLFKQEMKCTLKQYISNYRLDKAKEMLEQGFDKINEVAIACGYANGNYFAKVFKEMTDLTPQEYRKDFEKAHEKNF